MEQSAVEELKKLGEIISDPKLRKSFAADADKTLQGRGIAADRIPKGVLETLTELSSEELRVLAHVKKSLYEAKVSDEVKGEIV